MTNRLMMVTCAFASALTVQASTWTGAVGDDWTAPGNWNGGVPSAGDVVEIPATQVLPKIPAGRWPATGAYASFSVAEGATVTCLGDTTAVNETSGGTVSYPHGMGVTIVAESADIAGNLSAKGQGFKGVKTVADMDLEYPSHGGTAPRWSKTGYGRLSAPTALGTCHGTNPGGGAIALKISGELSLSGTIDADHGDQVKSTGGSVWLQAGKFSGDGTVSANGYAGSFRPGASGRIAIEAVEDTFDGTVSVWGIQTSQGEGNREYYYSAPGTIFRNTVANVDAFGWEEGAIALSSAYSRGSATPDDFPEVKPCYEGTNKANPIDEAMVVTRTVTAWDAADGLFAWTEQCGFKNKAGFVANTVTYTINGLRAGQPCVVTVNGSAAGSAADAEGSLTFAVELKGGFAQVEVDCSPSAKIAVLSPVTADGKDFTLSADVAELSGASAEATLYWDTEDRGTEASAWAHSAPAGTLTAPGRIAADVVDVAKGASYVYRFCLMDGTAVWSKPKAFTAASEPQLGAVSFTRTEDTGDLATFDVTLAAGSYADFKLLLADSDGVESVYEFGQVASGRQIVVGKPFSGVKAYTWRAVAENMYGAWTNAAQSADLWCYKWTGVAGDGKWFTPGNWEGNATPGAMPTMAVLIDGDGFAEAPVVEYVPTADFRPCATVSVKNGAKLVQAGGTHWMRFDENGADLVLDGGILDIGTATRCTLSNAVITAGGILTNSNLKTLVVTGSLEMDSGSIGPVSTGEYTMGPGWHVTGGTVLSPQGILNTPTTATDFGDAFFRVYGLRLKASGQRHTWRSGGVIVGNANGEGWSSWIFGEGNAYIDLTPDSTATFTYPMASSQIYEKAFKNWNARFRVNDKTVTEDEFRRYVTMSDFVYENGVAHGTTFGFRQTAIFADDGTIATDDGATFTATVGVELAGQGGSTLYLCYGAEDGGETIDGWETKIVATTPVMEAGSYSVTLPSTELEAATTYSWRLIAVNDAGEMATPAKTFTTARESTIGELTLGTVTEADGVFNVAYVGDLANLTVTVRDAEQNACTGSLCVTGDGTYEILVEGLKSETAYTWSVTAQNGWCSSSKDAPADQSFTTGVAVPARTAVRSGLWNDPDNWEPAGVPKAGNDVTIPAGLSITVDFETSTVDSLLLAEGATLVFDGWGAHLRVSGAVALNGTVTHVANSATAPDATSGEWVPNGRVNISCGDLTVGATGRIDARALGWAGTPEGETQPGCGPGGGQYAGYAGSHGGRGGSNVNVFNNRFEELAAEPYDSVSEPSLPGSGGYGQDRLGGGAGGGVVRIVASGVVTVDGVIDADGSRTTKAGNHWVGSAGGAVYVKCLRIAGSGRITANGGDAKYWAGGGGGGRIAIDYDPAVQTAVPTLVIQAKGGSSTWEPGRMYGRATDEHASYQLRNGHAFYGSTVGEMGTLWFPDSRFLTALEPAGGTLRLAGRWAASVTPTTLNVNGDLVLEDAALQLDTLEAFSVAGDLVLLGQDAKLGKSGQDTRSANRLGLKGCAVSVGGCLAATNAWLDLDAAPAEIAGDVRAKGLYLVVRSSDETEAPTFTVHGDMACETSFVHVYANADGAQPAAMADLATSGGALFTVKGVLSLATRSTVFPHSHPANGGSPWFHLGALSVGVGSAFDAKLLGFEGGKNKVAGNGAGRSGDGWSGGGFKTSPAYYVGTGAYGGNGGNTTNVNDIVYGKAYDVAYAPFGPGSCGANGESFSASSGGAIRILCDGAVTMDGDLIADGGNLQANWAAASSGGAIWIICRKFSGSAATSLLSAKGGDGAGGNSSVPAAGGRIAVWTNYKVGKLSDRQFAELLSGGLGEAVALDALPDWAGTATAVAGVEYTKSSCNTKVITPAEDGTTAWLKLPVNSGFMLRVR